MGLSPDQDRRGSANPESGTAERRGGYDRRLFPPRPEGRRHDEGRRQDDPKSDEG